MYGYNMIKRPQEEFTSESLLVKLYELLEEAKDEGIDNAEEIKFALQCADFESKLQKFIIEQKISQRVLIAVLSATIAGQIKKCPHVNSAQKQVFDQMSKIINAKE